MSASRGTLNLVEQSISNLSDAKTFISAGMEATSKTAADFAKIDHDDNSDAVNNLKDVMLSFCRMERDVKQFLDVANSVKTQAEGNDSTDLLAVFEKRLDEVKQKNSDEDLKSHKKLEALMELISDITEPDDPTDPIPQVVDEDLVMTQAEASTKCPYTGLEMVNPVMNKFCNHSYDFDGIKEFIKQRGKKAKCPVSGCINDRPLNLEDLVENKHLKKLIRKRQKTKNQQQSTHSNSNVLCDSNISL